MIDLIIIIICCATFAAVLGRTGMAVLGALTLLVLILWCIYDSVKEQKKAGKKQWDIAVGVLNDALKSEVFKIWIMCIIILLVIAIIKISFTLFS
jgi:hypothetical protein